jgi:hypothetical protein
VGRYWVENVEWDEARQALWDNAVRRATFSRRGQAVLREMEAALVALPEPKLIEGLLCDGTGVCAVGAIAAYRKVQGGMTWDEAFKALDESGEGDPGDDDYGGSIDDTARFAERQIKMAFSLAWEIAFTNDEHLRRVSPEYRHERMLVWVRARIQSEVPA